MSAPIIFEEGKYSPVWLSPKSVRQKKTAVSNFGTRSLLSGGYCLGTMRMVMDCAGKVVLRLLVVLVPVGAVTVTFGWATI
jgi:hypothetical protein